MGDRARALSAVARTAREFAEQTKRLHHRQLTDDGAAHRAETLLPSHDPAVPCGGRKMHQPDRLARRGAARTGNPGDGDGDIDVGGFQRANCHRGRGFLADGAEGVERRRLDPQHRPLRLVRVGDEAAVDDVGRSGNVGKGGGDHAPRAGLGRRDRQFAHSAQIEQRTRQCPRVAAAHLSCSGCPTTPRSLLVDQAPSIRPG